MALRKQDDASDPPVIDASPTPNPVVRLIRWFWKAWLVSIGLWALVIAGVFVKDGAWWTIPLFAFFGYVAYVQIRNSRRRRLDA